MSEPASLRCPPLAALMRISDGVASRSEREAWSSHLWRCATCRERLASADALAEECALVVGAEGPATWSSETFVAGLHHHVRTTRVRPTRTGRWIAAAAMVPAVILVLFLSRSHTAVVKADELIRRAVEIEETARESRQPANVRWTPEQATEERGSRTTAPTSGPADIAGSRSPGQTAADALILLRAYRFDPSGPLSAIPFRAWRASLTSRRDVVREHDGLLVLQTTTTQGDIRLAELVVGRDTYVPMRLSFVLEGRGRLDIEAHIPTTDVVVAGERSVSSETLSTAASQEAKRQMVEHAELRALLALRAVDLDLDGAVRVNRDRRGVGVRIEGAISTAARQKLSKLLSGVSQVHIDEAAASATQTPPPMLLPSEEARRWLDRKYGPESSEAKERFLPDLRRTAALTVGRLAALDDVARRYPESTLRRMAASDRALFQSLVEQHYLALIATLDHYVAQVAVLTESTPELPVATSSVPGDWRERVRRATAEAKQLEGAMGSDRLLTDWDSTHGAAGEVAVVRLGFSRLWSVLNAHGTE